jgi:hypothetical protein
MTTATDLIARSIGHNETVHAPYSVELHAALRHSCDDWTDTNDGTDYWYGDDDSDDDARTPWRVQLHHG